MLKKILLITTFLSLASCGFRPMQAQNFSYKLGKVTMHEIHSANSAFAIEKNLNREIACLNCEYTVDVDITKLKTNLVTQNDSTNIRSKLDLKLAYKVYNDSNKLILQDIITVSDSLNISNSPYASLATEEKITENLSQIAAQKLKIALMQKITLKRA